MSEHTQCLGTPYEFIYEGKTYKVSQLNQKIKGEFEQKQFARAIEAAKQLKPLMTKLEYQEYIRTLHDDFVAGEFGFESSRGAAMLNSKKAIITLCALMFGIDEEQMWLMMRTAEEEIANLLKLIMQEAIGGPKDEHPTEEIATKEEAK